MRKGGTNFTPIMKLAKRDGKRARLTKDLLYVNGELYDPEKDVLFDFIMAVVAQVRNVAREPLVLKTSRSEAGDRVVET